MRSCSSRSIRCHGRGSGRFLSRAGAVALGALLLATAAPLEAGARAEGTPAAASPDHKYIRTDKAMGTTVQLTFWTDDDEGAARASSAVFAELRRIDQLMTTWLPESDVSRINAAAGGKPVKVDAETIEVIEKSLEVAKATGGAFDITVGAFRGLWKFDQDMDGTLPSPQEIAARLPLVNYKYVIVDRKKRTVRLRKKGMAITLGGVAKGYAVDRAMKLLHEAGFVDFIIQAGGDMYVSGKKGADEWIVGIRDPRGARDAVFAVAKVEDRTFSTSGDYERGFVKDGVRYHHILDPDTGQPARRCRSVTVMARDAFIADAWDTAFFVLGTEKAMKLVEKLPELDAVIVDADNQVHVSSGLQGKVFVQKQPTPGV
jgi:FAD:protein FMN transferase